MCQNCLSFCSNVLFAIQWPICRWFVYGNQQSILLFLGKILSVFGFSVKLSTLPTFDCNTVAIFKPLKGTLKFLTRIQEIHMGYHTQISVENINNLLIYSQTTVPRGNVTPFEVKGPESGNC